jgi:hypothetical protein
MTTPSGGYGVLCPQAHNCCEQALLLVIHFNLLLNIVDDLIWLRHAQIHYGDPLVS